MAFRSEKPSAVKSSRAALTMQRATSREATPVTFVLALRQATLQCSTAFGAAQDFVHTQWYSVLGTRVQSTIVLAVHTAFSKSLRDFWRRKPRCRNESRRPPQSR